MAKQTPRSLDHVLDAIASYTGLSLCLRFFDPEVRAIFGVPKPHHIHDTKFCLAHKKLNLSTCRASDNDHVPPACGNKSDPFTRTCHAGATEIIVPLRRNDKLLGVVFMGQFRSPRRRDPAALPAFTRSQITRALFFARTLQSYLFEQIELAEHTARSHDSSVMKATRAFLADRIADDPRLQDLARHLDLSASRTSHIVSEATGQSFSHLKTAIRLNLAKDMLTTTGRPIHDIAREIGLADPNYFSRWFRDHTQSPPTDYRKKHTKRIPV